MYGKISLKLPLSYSAQAKLFWREAEKYFKQFRYPTAASFYSDSIEFSTKAICMFLGMKPPKKHDISKSLMELSRKQIFSKFKLQLARAALISSRVVGTAQTARELVKYGDPYAEIPADQLIRRKDVQPVRIDAHETCRLLCKIEIENKFRPPIKLGILNGYVDDSDSEEKPCSEFPFNEFKDIDVWRDQFSTISIDGKDKYNVERISIAEVTNEFAVVINPFGEAYPEKNLKTRFSFSILKEYIADGGVIVNTAGFPFFYAWDVNKGNKEPVVDEKVFIPHGLKIEEGKVIGIQYGLALKFAGSLLAKELGGITTSDTQTMSGVNPLPVKQTDKDKEIAGDLINLGGNNKVNEFRAIRPETKNVIPFLRAHREDFGEVYPLAAIRHGWGCLVTCGMHMNTQVELEKLVAGIDNFCNWARKNFVNAYIK